VALFALQFFLVASIAGFVLESALNLCKETRYYTSKTDDEDFKHYTPKFSVGVPQTEGNTLTRTDTATSAFAPTPEVTESYNDELGLLASSPSPRIKKGGTFQHEESIEEEPILKVSFVRESFAQH
jgi:hypothetical protein